MSFFIFLAKAGSVLFYINGINAIAFYFYREIIGLQINNLIISRNYPVKNGFTKNENLQTIFCQAQKSDLLLISYGIHAVGEN